MYESYADSPKFSDLVSQTLGSATCMLVDGFPPPKTCPRTIRRPSSSVCYRVPRSLHPSPHYSLRPKYPARPGGQHPIDATSAPEVCIRHCRSCIFQGARFPGLQVPIPRRRSSAGPVETRAPGKPSVGRPNPLTSAQFLAHTPELIHRRLEALGDLSGQDLGLGQVLRAFQALRVFQALVFQPENVQVRLIPLNQLVVRK